MTMDFTRLIDRLDPPADGETPVRHRTGTVTAVNPNGTLDVDLGGTVVPGVNALMGAAVGSVVQLLIWKGDLLALGRPGGSGFLTGETLRYESDDTFEKADYPGLRAVRVKAQGAGGGGGASSNTSASEASAASGGGGGTLAESFILASDLSASEPVEVGGGGSGGSTQGGDGSSGGDSSFGTHVEGRGGFPGVGAVASSARNNRRGGAPGDGTGIGDFIIRGSFGGNARAAGGEVTQVAHGGDSPMGTGGRHAGAETTSVSAAGGNGQSYGGGGGGGWTSFNSSGQPGGAGSDGVVIVRLYV